MFLVPRTPLATLWKYALQVIMKIHIQLHYLQIKIGHDCQDHPNGSVPNNWRENIIIIYSLPLWLSLSCNRASYLFLSFSGIASFFLYTHLHLISFSPLDAPPNHRWNAKVYYSWMLNLMLTWTNKTFKPAFHVSMMCP